MGKSSRETEEHIAEAFLQSLVAEIKLSRSFEAWYSDESHKNPLIGRAVATAAAAISRQYAAFADRLQIQADKHEKEQIVKEKPS